MYLPTMSERFGCSSDNKYLMDNGDGPMPLDGIGAGRNIGVGGMSMDEIPARPIADKKKAKPRGKLGGASYEVKPKEVFVELHELERSRMQWEQRARWIKYEQNAEGGLYRWSNPHIAHMGFKSLIELKKTMERGSLLLDHLDTDPSQIFHNVSEELARSGQIPEQSRTDVMRALLYEHKHVEESQGILRGMSSRVRRNTTTRRRLTRSRSSQAEIGRRMTNSRRMTAQSRRNDVIASPAPSVGLPTEETGMAEDGAVHFTNGGSTDIRMPILNGMSSSNGGLSRHAANMHLDDIESEDISRLGIPPDAEEALVLVGQLNSLDKPAACLVRLDESAHMSALTEVALPVRFIFILLGPVGSHYDYHELGRVFGALMSSEHFAETAYKADTIKDMISAMNDFIDDTVVLPAGNWDKDLLLPVLRIQNEKVKERKLRQEIAMRWATDPAMKPITSIEDAVTPMHQISQVRGRSAVDEIDPLKRTGIPFGGMANDIKRRYRYYLSDYLDALNGQCIAAIIFIFFASLSPAITFGGLLGFSSKKTDNWMGISEMVIGTAVPGIIFALFSGQPLCIIGVTGPILVFEENLYKFCASSDIEYLPFRFWTGFWMFIIAIICVAAEGSVLVRFMSRFTMEIFSFMISIIFIFECFNKLYQIYVTHPLMATAEYCDPLLPVTEGYDSMNVSAYLAYNLNGTGTIINGTIVGPVVNATIGAATTAGIAAKTWGAAGATAATTKAALGAAATTTATLAGAAGAAGAAAATTAGRNGGATAPSWPVWPTARRDPIWPTARRDPTNPPIWPTPGRKPTNPPIWPTPGRNPANPPAWTTPGRNPANPPAWTTPGRNPANPPAWTTPGRNPANPPVWTTPGRNPANPPQLGHNPEETSPGHGNAQAGTGFTTLMTTVYDNETFGNGSAANVCGSKAVKMENEPNTALLSTVLMFGTFMLANIFKIFKTSHYFGKSARKIVADFGIPISIMIMVGKDLLIAGVYTQKLDVPNGLVPTDACKRGWFVNPLGTQKPFPIMWIFGTILPALLAFILMFMESLITSLIVNKKDNKLKKGSGFHLDMFLLGMIACFNGLFGLPWVWAATVRSVTHTGALSVFKKGAPGEKPKLEMIREQRVTGLLSSVMIGLSIALAPLLKQVPLAVLFGVFLYMGVSSLNGIQFADRVFMLFMPVKHHADEKYVRRIRTWRMHLYTIIQIACVAMLWVVKISPAALAFPFFLIILVPIRSQLKRIFSKDELNALDAADSGDPEPEED